MGLSGVFPLNIDLYCKRDALTEYHCVIDDINCTLFFPLYNEPNCRENSCGILNPLIAPIITKTWNRKEPAENLNWGYPIDYPFGNSSVHMLAISIDPCDYDITHVANRIYDHFEIWKKSFIDYCLLSNKQLKNRIGPSFGGVSLELRSEKHIPPQNQVLVLSGTLHSKDMFLSQQQIKQACEFASSRKDLCFAFQMLLSSYYAVHSNNNRTAIVDACSALEICLMEQIKAYCKIHSIKTDILTTRYRSLEDHIELVSQIDNTFDTTHLRERVSKQRNYLLHNRNVFPSNRITDTLLSEVEKALAHFYTDYYKH